MATISWCKKQKNGLELVDPNSRIALEYLNEAKETLRQIKGEGSKWDVIMAYYACYHAFYSILVKAGIKCEIHNCTLELLNLVPGFTAEDYEFMQSLKEKRIQNQYYLKHDPLDNLVAVKKFVLKCNKLIEEININHLREKVK